MIFFRGFHAGGNFAAGIGLIFRGLKFSINAEIGENSHFWIGNRENDAP
jgi:hypothetical protein